MNVKVSNQLAKFISNETGLEFQSTSGSSDEGVIWYEFVPTGIHPNQSFVIRTEVQWRRIEVRFRLGRFAADLLRSMNEANVSKRQLFIEILSKCRESDAKIELLVNDTRYSFADHSIWGLSWTSFSLLINKGMLAINEGDDESDYRTVEQWTMFVVAAVLAILPLVVDTEEERDELGFHDGAQTRVSHNRYERDRRNRVAALSIHGKICKGCSLDLATKYGHSASRVIEVHHVQPVSEYGMSKQVNPRTDLVPLCPNCHAVVHLRQPPYTLDELKSLLLGHA